ncbi:MAG: hypothetical protein ACXV8P_05920 [Methylobacter sp.]
MLHLRSQVNPLDNEGDVAPAGEGVEFGDFVGVQDGAAGAT